MTSPPLHPVSRALNRPLTILGCERRLFFCALVVGSAGFNLLGSLLTGLLLFGLLYAAAHWVTRTDPHLPRIVINSTRLHRYYDPAKLAPGARTRSRRC
jgi:type IV secretory pathway TrbD component